MKSSGLKGMSLRRVQGRRVDSDRCKRLKSAGAGSRGTRWGKFGLFPREAEAHSLGRGLVTGGQHPCVLVEADWSFICGGATGSWKWRETNFDSYILDDPGLSRTLERTTALLLGRQIRKNGPGARNAYLVEDL